MPQIESSPDVTTYEVSLQAAFYFALCLCVAHADDSQQGSKK